METGSGPPVKGLYSSAISYVFRISTIFVRLYAVFSSYKSSYIFLRLNSFISSSRRLLSSRPWSSSKLEMSLICILDFYGATIIYFVSFWLFIVNIYFWIPVALGMLLIWLKPAIRDFAPQALIDRDVRDRSVFSCTCSFSWASNIFVDFTTGSKRKFEDLLFGDRLVLRKDWFDVRALAIDTVRRSPSLASENYISLSGDCI